MCSCAIPDDQIQDIERLEALRATGLLDSPPEASFDRLVGLASRVLRTSTALVSLVDRDRQFFKAAIGLELGLAGVRQTSLEGTICQHVVASGRPVVLNDTDLHPEYQSRFRIAYLGIPLVTSSGHAIGSFCVLDPAPRNWTEDEVAIMIDLAASVQTEIELRADIARRIQLESDLSEAKGRFDAYMRNSPALAFAKDHAGRITYANAAFERIYGPDFTWVGKTDYDLWPSEVADQVRANDLAVIEGGVAQEFIEETITEEGRRDRYLVLKFPYSTPDGQPMLGGMGINISQQLQAQEDLRRSEVTTKTLAMVVARIDGAVAIADASLRLEWVSEPYSRLFGGNPDSIIGQDLIRRSLSPDTGDDEGATLRGRLTAGHRVEVASLQQDFQGRKVWLELDVQAVRGANGAIEQFIAIAHDVTDRRRSAGRLAASSACDAILFESNSLDEAIPRLLRQIGEALDIDQATYWRVDPTLNRLVGSHHWTAPGRNAPHEMVESLGAPVGSAPSLEDELAARIWLERRSIAWNSEPTPDGLADDLARPTGTLGSGGFGWPVTHFGLVVGVFTFANHQPVDDVPLMESLSHDLWRRIGLFTHREEVEEERNRLVSIFERSDDFVGICDPHGLVIWRNTAYCQFLGQNSDLIQTGFPYETVYTDRSARLLREVALPEAARSGTWLGETEIRAADGRIIPVSQRVMACRGLDGEVAYYATILRDISAIKATEAELLAAKEAAEAASRIKGEFLANMSHEIRTPMNGILGMTDLTLDTDLSPLQRDYLGLVRSSAESLLGVINAILDFSKIEAGRLELELVRFNLHDLIDETLRPLALRAHSANLELVCHVALDVPEVVEGDPHRLRQILVNLVGNAVKFTPSGEVVVGVGLAQPESGATVADSISLHWTVTDTGIGIPSEKLAAIFEPFEQADGSTTRTYGGTGLGLAISSEVVRLMNGRLWVESTVGRGSVFHFTARVGRVLDQPDRGEVAILAGRRVVVAIKNATHRRITAEVYRNAGLIVFEEAGGLSVLGILRQRIKEGEPVDFAVIDDQLADLSGLDLIQFNPCRVESDSRTTMPGDR